MTAPDPEEEARLAGIAEQKARRERMTAQYGAPEQIDVADALALARTAAVPVDPALTADDWLYASVYRDDEAAGAWLESNRAHHGHPTLAKVPLPDGRVVGILDLRPDMERQSAERREWHDGWRDGKNGQGPREDASQPYLDGHRDGVQERQS
jgi:hypothetical protein